MKDNNVPPLDIANIVNQGQNPGVIQNQNLNST